MLPFSCVGDAIALLCGGGHGQVAVGDLCAGLSV